MPSVRWIAAQTLSSPKALKEAAGKRSRPIYVCHETGPAARTGLLDGTIDLAIATPIRSVARSTIAMMIEAKLSGLSTLDDAILDFHLCTPESI